MKPGSGSHGSRCFPGNSSQANGKRAARAQKNRPAWVAGRWVWGLWLVPCPGFRWRWRRCCPWWSGGAAGEGDHLFPGLVALEQPMQPVQGVRHFGEVVVGVVMAALNPALPVAL